MMAQDRELRAVAIFSSLLLHGTLLLTVANTQVRATVPEREAEETIRVRLNFPAPPTVPQPAVEPPQEPELVPEPEPEPAPPPEPEPVVEPEPLPEPEPPPKPKPEEAKPRQKTPPKPKPSAPPQVKRQAPPPTASAAPPAPDPETLKAAYLARLLELIEARKQYPEPARRRSIEGRIQVRLRVLANGQVDGLEFSGGHKLLRLAAQKAIEDALPLPAPPQSPYAVAYAMEFKLD